MLSVALITALLQGAEPIVIYTRGPGIPLPAYFIQKATETARAQGGQLWVIAAQQLPGVPAWSLDLYFAPVSPTAAVRRGTHLSILAGEKRGGGRIWVVERTENYAQVPLLTQHPYEIRSESDPARPFAIDGELSDLDILSVVAFLRSSPRYREGRTERRVDGQVPIQSLTRTSDGRIKATLGHNHDHGTAVLMQRLDDEWSVTGVLQFTR